MTPDQIRELEIAAELSSWPAMATEMPRLIADWRRQETEIARLRLEVSATKADVELEAARNRSLESQLALATHGVERLERENAELLDKYHALRNDVASRKSWEKWASETTADYEAVVSPPMQILSDPPSVAETCCDGDLKAMQERGRQALASCLERPAIAEACCDVGDESTREIG